MSGGGSEAALGGAPLPPLVGGVLAGGASRRMGRAKAELTFLGRRFIDIVVDALGAVTAEVQLLGGSGPLPLGAAGRLADAEGVAGPLAGILAAFRHRPDAAWLVAACDLPLVTPEALRWLVAQRRADRWAVLPRCTPGGVEPLLALYEPPAAPFLEALTEQRGAGPSRLAGHLGVTSPTPPPPLAAAWTNVNEPDDLAQLAATLAGRFGGRR